LLCAGLQSAAWITADATGVCHGGRNGHCAQIGNGSFTVGEQEHGRAPVLAADGVQLGTQATLDACECRFKIILWFVRYLRGMELAQLIEITQLYPL
jgi:hypothetical protein